MRRYLLPFLLLLSALCAPVVMAQKGAGKKLSFYIIGNAFDRVTRLPLDTMQAVLLTADSVALDTVTRGPEPKWSKGRWEFNLRDYGTDRDYLVRVTSDGYYPAYVRIRQSTFADARYGWLECPKAELTRLPKTRDLQGATVTATKVKFYHKGDTLVYNADALNLGEGSMLDAIIRQMPGAELRSNGQIFVGGKKVDDLLLNGKDFFKGDPSKMLENLPAYMVKHIQVYNKDTETNEFLGREVEKKRYVMDVKLKKEYNKGYMLNLEAAGGTNDRYLGRLFALRFTDRSRLSLVGNVNNVSETRQPGENTEWTPDMMPQGRVETQTGGLDYSYDDSYSKTRIYTTLQASHTRTVNASEQSGVNFLEGGDTWSRSFSNGRSDFSSVNLNHNFSKDFERVQLQVSVNAGYTRNKSFANSAAATFSANPSLYLPSGASMLDTLQGPAGGDLLRRLAINRTLSESDSHSDNGNAALSVSYIDKKGWEIRASTDWRVQQASSFEHYTLDYPAGTTAPTRQNRYGRTSPNRHAGYSLSIDKWFYDAWIKGFSIVPSYKIRQSFDHQTYDRHLLERLAGWNDFNAHPIGTLPSDEEWLRSLTRDSLNAYDQRLKPLWQEVCLAVDYKHRGETRSVGASLRVPLVVNMQWLDYTRADYSGVTRRTDLSTEPMAWGYVNWADYAHMFNWSVNVNTILPDLLTHLISLPSTADPLNVTTGNPDLKNGSIVNLNLSYYTYNAKQQSYLSLGSYSTFKFNDIIQGAIYDNRTGITYRKPYNVSGAYSTNVNLSFGQPLDKKYRRLVLSGSTGIYFTHSVDLLHTVREGLTDEGRFVRPDRSTGDNWWTTQSLSLTYQIKKVTVGINGYGGYNATRSARPGFRAQNVWQYRYGATLQAPLFWKLSLSTDLKVYAHRGFSDPAGNTDNLVWNARLACRLTKPALSLFVEGFDLLHQLSSRTFTMTSLGRTESWRNSLPSYFMLHAVWRFSQKPKKQGT